MYWSRFHYFNYNFIQELVLLRCRMYSLTRSSNKKFVKKTIYQLKLSNIRANYVYGCGFSSINAPSVHNNINGSLTTKPIHQTGLSVLRVNSAGQVDSLYITVDKFLREKMMHARDLLALGVTHSNGTGTGIYNKHQDMEETHNNRPLLLPRANSLIASFGNIRTIIYKDHVLIIDPGSTAGSLHSDHIRIFAESLSRSIFVKNEHKYQQARDIRDRSGLGQDSEHMDTDAYSSFKYKSVSDRNTNTVGTTTSYSHGRDDGHLTNGLESSYNSNSNIQSKSKEDIERNSEYEFEAPFELHVLEELLKNMCETYDRRMVLYRPLGHSLLKQVELSDTIEGIHKLLPLSDALYEFELSIKEAQHCLLDILDDEEELSDLLLSDYHRTRGSDSNGSAQTKIPSKGEWKKDGIENNHSHNNHHNKRWDVPSKGSSPDLEQLVDEIKILLESYTLRLNNSLNDVLLLQKKVKNRQSLTDLSMQVQRNRLLSLNLNLGVAAVCLGASTAMSGWFGMNLLSGKEGISSFNSTISLCC